MKVKVHGCRGSVAYVMEQPSRYGRNTSCMSLSSGGYPLIIDAGSGILNLNSDEDFLKSLQGPADILLSHLHLDHIIGLCAFSPAFNKDRGIAVHTLSRGDRSLINQVFGAFAPPYWPVPLEKIVTATCLPVQVDMPFIIGPFTIKPFVSCHPDNAASFHITDGSKSLVYLLDNEVPAMDEASYEKLVKYCQGVDLVVFDSAYDPAEYHKYVSWGHSTVKDGMRLHKDSGCKKMLFTHFDQKYGDHIIDSWQEQYNNEECIYAYETMEMSL